VACGKQPDPGLSEFELGIEWKPMFDPATGQACGHEQRGGFGKDHFLMIPNVVAMGMRNKSRRLLVPRIEPKIQVRKENTSPEVDLHLCTVRQKLLIDTCSASEFDRDRGI
jgi:hypothetical protein